MKTTSVYHGFAMQHEELNQEVVKRTLGAAPVERLYLLGLTTRHRRIETLYSLQSATRNEVAHYYLLVLVEKEDGRSLNNLQDKIETHLQAFLPITAIVLSNAQFSKWLLEGHPFASGVHQRGYLLYQKNEVPFPYPAVINEEIVKADAERLRIQTKTRAQEFLAGAELYSLRMQYKIAAFMLHQAAEQILRTMFIIKTGLRINTHSIDKLVRYCTMFLPELPDVLPCEKEKDKRLFQLLQKAYIDTRYKEEYSIKLAELSIIKNRIINLYSLFLKQQVN